MRLLGPQQGKVKDGELNKSPVPRARAGAEIKRARRADTNCLEVRVGYHNLRPCRDFVFSTLSVDFGTKFSPVIIRFYALI